MCADGVPLELSIDALRVTQILLNLTGNAIKFTERGQVRVKVDWIEGILQIDIVDTSTGMDETALVRICEAFTQADSTIPRNHGETGLGLTISRNLAQKMGGDISARSRVGEGTVFTVRIEALQVEQVTAKVAHSAAQQDCGLKAEVLLVDDTLDIRGLVALHLRRLGLTVSTANDGQEGLEMALRDSSYLVLMDVEMPGMNGQQVTRALRQRRFTGVILALTAHRDEGLLRELSAAGCDGVVNKPVSREDLASAMHKYLAGGAKSAELISTKQG